MNEKVNSRSPETEVPLDIEAAEELAMNGLTRVLEKRKSQTIARKEAETAARKGRRGLAVEQEVEDYWIDRDDEEEFYDDDYDDDDFWDELVWDEETETYVDDEEAIEHNRLVEERYGRHEFDDEHRAFEVLPLSEGVMEKYPFIAELPRDVGIMGGMARSIAREMIAGDSEPIRDIDLVQIVLSGENAEFSSSSEEVLDQLAQKYMSDDYSYGHGIQSTTMDEYFRTRDLTVNEVLIMGGALVLSNYAYNDLQENIIRPTYYEKKYTNEQSSSRNVMRALSMQATLLETANSYPTLEDFNIRNEYVGSFDVAVQLNKMMSRGAEYAQRFTELLANYDIIPQDLAGKPLATAKYWRKYRTENFEFRMNNDEMVVQKNAERSIDESLEERVYSSDPAVRVAMKEYASSKSAERVHGHYAQSEFDEINRQEYEEDEYDYDEYD